MMAQWLATNLEPAEEGGGRVRFSFDIETICDLFADFCSLDMWDFLHDFARLDVICTLHMFLTICMYLFFSVRKLTGLQPYSLFERAGILYGRILFLSSFVLWKAMRDRYDSS